MTIGESIARVRTLLKANSVDAFITDRFIWSLISKHADFSIFKYRHSSNIISSPDLYTTLFGFELEEQDLLAMSCLYIPGLNNCNSVKIYKSKEKLPSIRVINDKWLIKSVTSVDFSFVFTQVSFGNFSLLLNNRFRKFSRDNYYAVDDGYLYIFDLSGKEEGTYAVNITAAFSDASHVAIKNMCYDCDKPCVFVQDGSAGIPSSLMSEIEAAVLQDILSTMYQVQQANAGDFDNNDNKHIGRNE